MIAAIVIIALVALQRLAELPYAMRNTRRLLERGAVETGRGHYPLLIVLHAAWLIAIAFCLPANPPIHWPLVGVYLVLEILRAWVVVTLGPYWTTRVVTLPGAPLIETGPYRYLRHPNYWIVVGEVALLPLVFGEVWVAVVFSVLNGALLLWRIRIEDAALAPRREHSATTPQIA